MTVYNAGSHSHVFFGYRKCLYCGKRFKPRSNAQFYCDSKCMRLNAKRPVVYKRKDIVLTCVICGEPITGKHSYMYHHDARHCAIKADYYQRVRRWLNRVKYEEIKNSIDYMLLQEKVKLKILSWEKSRLKINGKAVELHAVAHKKFERKHVSKDSQRKPRPYIRKGKWKKHQLEALNNGKNK